LYFKPYPKQIPPEQIASSVFALYGFSAIKMTLLPEGLNSAVWKFENYKKLIVKIYGLEEGPLRRLEDEAKLYCYLDERGFHTPLIIPNRHNRSISRILFQGNYFYFMIMRYESLRIARASTITPEELKKIVAVIAKIHRILFEYPGGKKTKSIRKPFCPDKTFFETLINTSYIKRFSKEEIEEFHLISLQMENYIKSFPSFNRSTKSLIHADLSLEHCQFLPDGDIYLFDFCNRHWGPVALDIGIFLIRLFQTDNIPLQRWEALKKLTLKTYQEFLPLNKNDRRSIEKIMIRELLKECKGLTEFTNASPSRNVDSWIKKSLELGEYILNC